MSRVKVRRAVVADVAQLSEIAWAAKASWGYPIAWLEEWREALTFTPEYVSGNVVFVAEEREQPIAVIALEAEPEPEIGHLWVLPSQQGRGVGAALVGRARQYAASRGWSSLRIESDPLARPFYERLGAIAEGQVEAPVGGEPRYLPVLRLGAQMLRSLGWLVTGAVAGYLAARTTERSRQLARKFRSPHPLRQVVVPAGRRADVEENGVFRSLLQIGRMMNSLRFAQMAPYGQPDVSTPHRERQMIGGFLVQTAFLQEILETLPRLGQELKHLDAWRTKVVPMMRSPDVKRLRKQSLRDLRSKVVFHFDTEATQRGVKSLDSSELVIWAQKGTRRRDVYYPASDEAVMSFLFPEEPGHEGDHRERLEAWISRITDLSLRVTEACEDVFLEGALSLDLSFRQAD